MSRPGKLAIAGTSCVLLALLLWSGAVPFGIRDGVPRSQRLGLLDPGDTRPQTFVFRQPDRLAGISLVSAAPGGDSLTMPTELPRALRIRIVAGSREIATQEVLTSSLIPSNWQKPHRSCFFIPEASLEVGASYTLEITSLDPSDRAAPLQVVLEFIDHGA